jgi:hypothetical protein
MKTKLKINDLLKLSEVLGDQNPVSTAPVDETGEGSKANTGFCKPFGIGGGNIWRQGQ